MTQSHEPSLNKLYINVNIRICAQLCRADAGANNKYEH